jgi:hypothetical protein
MSSEIPRHRRQEKKSFATCGSQLIVSFATILSYKIVANKHLQKTFFFLFFSILLVGAPKERVIGQGHWAFKDLSLLLLLLLII